MNGRRWSLGVKTAILTLLVLFLQISGGGEAGAAGKAKKAAPAPAPAAPAAEASLLEPLKAPDASKLPAMQMTEENANKVDKAVQKLGEKVPVFPPGRSDKHFRYHLSFLNRAFYEAGFSMDRTIIKLAKDLGKKPSLRGDKTYEYFIKWVASTYSTNQENNFSLQKYVSTEVLAAMAKIHGIASSMPPPGLVDRYPYVQFDFKDEISSAYLSPDSLYLIARYGYWNGLFIYNLRTREKMQLCERVTVHDTSVSPDQQYIAAARGDSSVSVFKLGSWEEVVKLKLGNDCLSVTFSPDGKYLAAGSSDRTARIYETATWKELHSINHPEKVKTVYFNDKSDLFVTACGDEFARVFKVGSGEEVAKVNHRGTLNYAAFYKNSSLLSTGGNNVVRVFDAGSWQEIATRSSNASGFSPDGRYFVSGNDNGAFRQLADFKEPEIPLQSGNPVVRVNFSPDGRTLATDANNSPIRFFDTQSWKEFSTVGDTLKYLDNAWVVAGGKSNLNLYEVTLLTLYALKSDLEEFGFAEVAKALALETQAVDDDYQSRLKELEEERDEAYAGLSSTKKDEFESQKEYEQRMSERSSAKWSAEAEFTDDHLNLKLEEMWKRKALMDKYSKILDSILSGNRLNVAELKASLGTYSPEAETFPITIYALSVRSNDAKQAVEPFRGTVSVPRAAARAFKEKVDSYSLSAELLKSRTGGRRLVNIVMSSPDGKETFEFAKMDNVPAVNLDEVKAVLSKAKEGERTVLDMGSQKDFRDKGLRLLERAKTAAKIPGREKESAKWRDVAMEYLGESFVSDVLPIAKNYPAGTYTFKLKAGEQMDHWIAWNNSYTCYAREGERFERAYARDRVYQMGESGPRGEFKFRAITDCTITFDPRD